MTEPTRATSLAHPNPLDHDGVSKVLERDRSSALQNAPLLRVENLSVGFETHEEQVRVVEGVSFEIHRGERVGLVGESGCGKSATALAIMRLLPIPPAFIDEGRVHFLNRDLLELPEREMRHLRGDRMAMIFQEPMTALNPLHRVGDQVAEVLLQHRRMTKREALEQAVSLLEKVQIPEAARRARDYPHQLSGGMRQRVMIAMALACHPDILIADEPTTALDVTVQAQILDLLERLTQENQAAVLLITHDMGIVAELCHRVMIMYAGQIVESGPVDELFAHPLHPYTQGLLRSLPKLPPTESKALLAALPGTVPDPRNFPTGCRFHPRCPLATTECQQEMPVLEKIGNSRSVRCWQSQKAAGTGEKAVNG